MKVLLVICISIIALIQTGYATVDYVPKVVLFELATSSTSDQANDAYLGVEAVMESYHRGKVIPIRYYSGANGGNYSSESVDQLIDDYNISHFPTAIVNGQHILFDDYVSLAGGRPYLSLIEREYYKPSPVSIEDIGFDAGSGNIQAVVRMLAVENNSLNGTVRIILLEDDITAGVTNVAREVISRDFNLSGTGGTIEFNESFNIDSGWVNDNFRVVISVSDENGYVIQAASTYEYSGQNIRPVISNQRIDIGASSGVFDQDYFTLFNLGESQDLTINVNIDKAPNGWFLTFCDEELCYFGAYSFTIESGEYRHFYANVMPSSIGMMDYSFVIESTEHPTYYIPLRYITEDVDYLIIDGDGWNDYETYISEIMEASGYSYGVWDTGLAGLKQNVTEHFSELIWLTGENYPSLSEADRIFLADYLERGKNLFISGQNIGRDLVNNPYVTDESFYQNYLNAELIDTPIESRLVNGVNADPISDGLSFYIEGSEGADNQYKPESVQPFSENGVAMLNYDGDETAGIRSLLSSGANVIYLAFGFEAIADSNARSEILLNSLNFFSQTNVEDLYKEIPSVSSIELSQSYPNPFVKPSISERSLNNVRIDFKLSGEISPQSSLTIYNIKGQRVKSFSELDTNKDGYGYVAWDGADHNGSEVGSGVYFYVLTTPIGSVSHKLLLVR